MQVLVGLHHSFMLNSFDMYSHPATNVGEPQTAVSPLLGLITVALQPFLLDDWGGDHWLPQIGLRSPGHGSTFVDLVSWRNIQ